MANEPDYKAVAKTGDKFWSRLGAGWIKGDKVSVLLNVAPLPSDGKLSFLLVPNGSDKE